MRFTLATVFALVAAVSAQSLGDISPCASNCSTAAIPDSGCGTITNVTCVCTNTDFQSVVAQCLKDNCTPEEEAGAIAFQGTVCGALSGSTTGGASDTSAPTGSNSAGAPTGSGTGSVTPKPSGTQSSAGPSSTSTTPGDSAARLSASFAVLLAVAGLAVAL